MHGGKVAVVRRACYPTWEESSRAPDAVTALFLWGHHRPIVIEWNRTRMEECVFNIMDLSVACRSFCHFR